MTKSVTKNDHFLKGPVFVTQRLDQLDPPVGDEKCNKNEHFLKGPVGHTNEPWTFAMSDYLGKRGSFDLNSA